MLRRTVRLLYVDAGKIVVKSGKVEKRVQSDYFLSY